VRNPTSAKAVLGLLAALLIVAGCSSKGVISGRVLVPPSAGSTASDSSAANTVVFIAGNQRIEAPAPGEHPEITQTDDGFHPHVLPVTQGTEVKFRNKGEVYHNAFSVSPAKKFDVGTYAPGETRSVILDQLGIVNVFCELHPTSASFIVVVPDQYYARPDATGAFSMPRLPGGKYTLKAWHPIFGEISQEVVLPGKKDIQLELEF
jgi:plastocyanin